MAPHFVCRAVRIAAAHRLGKFLMAGRRIVRLRRSHDAEPDRRERVRFLDRIEQRGTARALRDPRMKFLMHRLIERTVHLLRQLIDPRGKLLQLSAFARCRDLSEADRRLYLERFAHDVVSLHVFW